MKHTFKSLIKKIIIEQSESQEYAEISAQEFKDLAKLASYNLNVVSKMKRFGGKKIKVIGDLDLSDVENLNSLGNLAIVVGRFDISGTKVSDLSKLEEVSAQVNTLKTSLPLGLGTLINMTSQSECETYLNTPTQLLDMEFLYALVFETGLQ
jgi:hypothetical protein